MTPNVNVNTNNNNMLKLLLKKILLPIKRRQHVLITKDFLLSSNYRNLMLRYLPHEKGYNLYEAQDKTKNFCYRHFKLRHRLGVFRWRGIFDYLDTILPLISNSNHKIVDFGGAACPLGFNSIPVDQLKHDIYGRSIQYHTLEDLPEKANIIFSSHCLEHIEDLEIILSHMKNALIDQGILICLLPAFTCERWRVGTHKHDQFKDHHWTFGLSNTENLPSNLVNYINVDTLIKKYFYIQIAEYCGDNSIFILAKK